MPDMTGRSIQANFPAGNREIWGNPECGSESHRGARCGKTARQDLCGGRRVTGVPTATTLAWLIQQCLQKYERMHFEIIGDITDIEPIATGPSIRILPFLRRRYGRGRWRKLKGKTLVRLQMERFDVPNFIGLKRMALASGRCGSNASWTKDYAYPSKT